MVLQVDHEHVIEWADRRHRWRGRRWGGYRSPDGERNVVGVGVVVVAGERVVVRERHCLLCAAGAHRDRPSGVAFEQLSLEQTIERGDWCKLADAQRHLAGV